MCGICGKITYSGEPVQEDLLRKMCRTFSYRGPDDEGLYFRRQTRGKTATVSIGLGHRRLSIIDLSPAGRQPMSNEDKSVWVTYNGEIYNFKNLRHNLQKKGHVFKSNTDTEILLHQYEEDDISAVHHFNGMFAFALWDEKRARLWLCRDRLGIKPLVYYWDGDHFVFASEIKALLCDPSIPKMLDHTALAFYLAFSYIPAPYTIFKGIRKLEPGHSLILEDGKLATEKYWDVPHVPDPGISSLPLTAQIQFYQKRLFERLSEAVQLRLIADVPLGAFLSGGIDSSIIAALMTRHSPKRVKTFSIGFKDVQLFDETRFARKVADRYKTDHHEFKLISSDLLDIFAEVLSTFGEPFADSSAIPTFIVSRETKKYVTVALSGDGGDELFAGYRSYLAELWRPRYLLIPALVREGFIEKLVSTLPDSRDDKIMETIRRLKKFIKSTRGTLAERFLSLKEIFPKEIRKNLLLKSFLTQGEEAEDPALNWIQGLLAIYSGDPLNRLLYADLKGVLPGDMLTKVDRMSMKNSLEVRVPFLDHRVVELVFGMQGALKLHRGKAKYILKETFRELLPQEVYHRAKAGFEVPIGRWFKTDLNFLLDQYLGEKKIKDQGIFDHQIVQRLIKEHLENRTDTSWMLWNLVVFQFWYEKYFS
ncbi:asparagine synthase (glutamine-hydrolyzing) [Thermodesulfobacteriota bacterium]